MAESGKRFSEGDVVYFIDDYTLPGNVNGDGQVHRGVVSGVNSGDTIAVGIIDGHDVDEASVFLRIDPLRARTAEEVMKTLFQLGSREVLAGIQLAVE